MVRTARVAEPVPFSAINVTPFIDVMLLLLIVMILSIPVATHEVPMDLPQPGPAREEAAPTVLAIDRGGRLYWNGAPLADADLPARLAAVQASGAVLHLQTDAEARYERFDAVLATVKRAGITRLGFVGNRPLDD